MRYDRIRRVLVVVVAGLLFPPAALLSQQQKTFPPRSVRFSSIAGSATVTPPGATDWDPARLNTPIIEGTVVSTLDGGIATVKLENGSTIELDELSQVAFTKLSTDASGAKQSVITLDKGHCNFHFDTDEGNSYVVKIADATLVPDGKANFHAAFVLGKVQVRVLTGSVIASAHSASLTLGKGKSMEYSPSAEAEVATSHVRVVRLSFVSGTVMLKRPGEEEAETAMLNTPIQEGFELSTSGSSYAEVEFENGSTARIGEQSKLLFHQLALDANGNKLNGLTFEQGYATFHFAPERNAPHPKEGNGAASLLPDNKDVYHVKFSGARITADGKCEFRTDLEADRYRVEVFAGSVNFSTPAQSIRLGEGKVLENKPNSTEAALSVKGGIVKDDWDQWTAARDKQALLTAKDESVHAVGPSYGWGELNTYGEWVSLSGGRFGWSPYARAGWTPYTNGYWKLIPGLGWTWIPVEPWGWLTDHCGSWDFDDGFGWFWTDPMFGCGSWYPSMVNWYAGQGWVGWAPIGQGHLPPNHPPHGGPPGRPHPGPGPAPHPVLPARQVVTVPTAVVQNGQMITPQIVNRVGPTEGSLIERPPFEPNVRTISSATLHSVDPGTAASNPAIKATAAPAPTHAGGPKMGFANHTSAPSTILMGGNAAIEAALLPNHSFHSGHQPLRAFGGTTLGGHYEVHGSPGEARGHTVFGIGTNGAANRMSGPASAPNMFHAAGGPVGVVPHGHGQANSGASFSRGGPTGGISRGSGGSAGTRGGGGSYSGGHAGGGGGVSSGGGHSGGGESVSGGGGGHSAGSGGGGGGSGGHH